VADQISAGLVKIFDSFSVDLRFRYDQWLYIDSNVWNDFALLQRINNNTFVASQNSY